MRTRILSILSLVLILTLVLSPSAGQARQIAPQAPAIRLKAATFTPQAGELPALPPGLDLAQSYRAGQRGYFIVQFRGPVEQAWKDQVTALGVELLDYIPDYAFKVRMSPEQAAAVSGLEPVGWVGIFHPAYKLSPDLASDGVHLYRVRVESGADAGRVAEALAHIGAAGVTGDGNLLLVATEGRLLPAVAQQLDVAWVENYVLPEKHNDTGGGVVMGSNTANSLGYDGSSQIVAVADTGLGGGTAATAPVDIPANRIVAIYDWPGQTDSCFTQIIRDGSKDVDSGHGTHTAGSVLSDGEANGLGKGTAPAARLVFQSTEDYAIPSRLCQLLLGYTAGYYLTGLPADLTSLFQQAYDAGARIHSNSWGSAVAGDYTTNSVNADTFIWNHRDMTITFSAGNNGVDANSDGVIDNDSIGAPGTAKNVITVGASENARTDQYPCDTNLTYTNANGESCASLQGKNTIFTWYEGWPTDYPAEPIRSDPSAGGAGQMAAFSSRGPTDDGRIKPDVVAPGTHVLSIYSDLYQQGYDASTNPQNNAWQYDGWGFPLNSRYKYMGGTSMSNPLVAGGAAVVRDFYQKAYGLSASAALVKATLINSAVDMLDENNDGVSDNDYPIPNNHEGWGRVDLAAATDGSAAYVDNTAGLSTNGVATYQYNTNGAGPFKVTVVWSDYPSTDAATKNLVNDLNLTVTGPGGVTYRGNIFSGGWSQTGGSADNTNNVENVYVQSAVAGAWTVEVRGANVPNGPQPFALVVDGTAPATPPAAPSGLTATAVSTSQINLSWTDNAGNETGFKVERCQGVSCSNFTQVATVAANLTTYQDTGLAAATPYTYQVRATNSAGDSDASNPATATTQSPPQPPAAPSGLTATAVSSNRIDLGWTDNASNEDGFKIERCQGAGCTSFSQIATVGANVTIYADTTVAASTNYTYQVRATNGGGDSVYSNTASATTPAPANPPAAPSGLTASAASASQVNLAWTDNANNEDGFKIERCSGAGCSTFTQIATVPADTTSFANTGLAASTSYSYRVRAYNANGDSAYSNTASATTPALNTGFLSPAANAAQNGGDGNGFEVNPANAYSDNATFAVDNNSGTGTSTSCTAAGKDKHRFYNYSINLPAGSTVLGIQVRLDARVDSTANTPRMCVQLSWDGGSSWTSAKTTGTLTTAENTYTLGGTADTWGRTWSTTNLSNTNFRVRIINIASSTARDFSLDWLAVQVTYR